MNSPSASRCGQCELVSAYALGALSPGGDPFVEAHIASCAECRRELESLQPVLDALAYWPADVLRPSASLKEHLARRIAEETGAARERPARTDWREPEWEEVAPGISCKLLATDTERDRVSMLVRLAPGADYPPHTHAGLEELHLLDGELWIDERKLYPGDYNRAHAGTGDKRVWSETGCTCVLITSTKDALG
ncbi:MAG TPA: cupin domain-containing protein [Burkholderiales bacterium]|nr:cupin domain-containing protein [Burkholderiales bacterium]